MGMGCRVSEVGHLGAGNQRNTMSIPLPKSDFARTLGLAIVTSWGLGLSLTVLDGSNNTWIFASVLIPSLVVSPVLAGWLSSRLRNAVLFPVCVLVTFSVATAINESLYFGAEDSPNHGYEPVGFAVFHSVLFGGGTYLIFCAGWIARHYFGRLLGHKTTTSHMAIAALVTACYSVGVSISLYTWIIDDKWSPLQGWNLFNASPLLLGSMAVLAGAAIMWSDGHNGRGSLTGLGLSLLYLGGTVTLTFFPTIAVLYGLAAFALVALAFLNIRRWKREEAHHEGFGN